MTNTTPPTEPGITLESLFNHNQIWRGASYRPEIQTLDTGYKEINQALLQGGWPKSTLIEICQKGLQQQEWLVFLPVVKAALGYVILLNPPAIPFCQAFIQAGIDLERVLVVQVNNKSDFLASFKELARTQACDLLFAWQQHQQLSYTELRKCLLATNDSAGVCVLFRSEHAQQQSSPAVLRLQSQITANHIQLSIFKQKGVLQQSINSINLPLPELMKGYPPYSSLDQTNLPDTHSTKRKSATVMPLRRNKK